MSRKTRLRFTADDMPGQKGAKEKAPPKKAAPEKAGGKQASGLTARAAGPKDKPIGPTTLHFEENRPKPPSKLVHSTEQAVSVETHRVMQNANEDDNVAAEAVNSGQAASEHVIHAGVHTVKQIREHRSAPARRDDSELKSAKNPQKQRIKKQYAKAKTREIRETGTQIQSIKDFAEKTVEKVKSGIAFFRRSPKGITLVLILFILLSMLTNIVSSCSLIMEGIGSSIAGSTYPSADADMLAAEAEYSAMEAQLQRDLDHYEEEHDYDEYSFDLDSIGHDPYVLISTLTALHDGEWTIDEVRETLSMLFEMQYELTETVHTTHIHDPDDPEAEPQEYRSADVKLKNNDLSHLQYEIMSEAQLARYSVYMATLGNRSDLFPGSAYIGRYGEGSYVTYDIPPEALEDEAFAAMIAEAEKYLGYPYVWGGSSPSTSFDCSGFVCWVLNHSGWNVGRTTAQGLCSYCTPVRYSDARPGDLVFFIGTYDTPEVSHVGIYVGNDMMIQCGDPITYSNLNSSYWQEHLYCYGRLPGRSA